MNPTEAAPRPGTFSVDIVNLLQDMGLTAREVEIYGYLLSGDGATPSAIARDTGNPRGRIYEGLRTLCAKGLARERPTRPIVFCPTPLVDVLAGATARLVRHLDAVRRAQAADAAVVQGRSGASPAPPMQIRDVSVFSGRRACYAAIVRMLETASSSFWIGGGGQFANRLCNMTKLIESIQVAADRGVDVRVMFPHQPLRPALALIDAGRPRPLLYPIKGDTSGPLVSCANDTVSFEMKSQPDDAAPSRGDDVGIQVVDPLFAAQIRRRLGARLPTPVQVAAAGVYPWLGPDHGSDIFADAIGRATTEVQVLGPAAWGAYLQANWARTAPVFAAAVKRGVVLRVVATRAAGTEADFKEFRKYWNTRLADDLPMWMTIVDGEVLFQAFPHSSLGGQPQFRRSEEPHEIRFYERIFDRLWNVATPLDVLPPFPADVSSGVSPAGN